MTIFVSTLYCKNLNDQAMKILRFDQLLGLMTPSMTATGHPYIPAYIFLQNSVCVVPVLHSADKHHDKHTG